MSKSSIMTGFSFGLTSGVITTLGLMVGLQAGTQSKLAVIGGILTIAVADALSDALGVHISQESQNTNSVKEIWIATISTFLSKFLFALSFIVPVIFISLTPAVLISVLWGLLVLSVFSIIIAKKQKEKPIKVVLEHLSIGLIVILITHFLGKWVALTFSE